MPPARARRGAVARAGAGGLRGQSGFGLIEVLVTVVLAGLVVVALAAGLLTLVRATDSNEQRQQVQLALGNFSESLRAVDYLDCVTAPDGASADEYQDLYDLGVANWQPELNGMTAGIIDVEYWDPSTRAFVDTCSVPDQGAQQLTVQVSWRGRTDRAQIVIGDR